MILVSAPVPIRLLEFWTALGLVLVLVLGGLGLGLGLDNYKGGKINWPVLFLNL